jgi:hypothetical protein
MEGTGVIGADGAISSTISESEIVPLTWSCGGGCQSVHTKRKVQLALQTQLINPQKKQKRKKWNELTRSIRFKTEPHQNLHDPQEVDSCATQMMEIGFRPLEHELCCDYGNELARSQYVHPYSCQDIRSIKQSKAIIKVNNCEWMREREWEANRGEGKKLEREGMCEL